MPLDLTPEKPPYYTIDETLPTPPDNSIESEYRATLTQTGTNAPTATEATTNTLNGIVWTRAAQGIYSGTLAGAFPVNKTWLDIQAIDTNVNNLSFNRLSENQVQIVTRNLSFTAVDDVLTDTQIQITITK